MVQGFHASRRWTDECFKYEPVYEVAGDFAVARQVYSWVAVIALTVIQNATWDLLPAAAHAFNYSGQRSDTAVIADLVEAFPPNYRTPLFHKLRLA